MVVEEVIQRVRCGPGYHRIRWSKSGGECLDHPDGDAARPSLSGCARRVREWEQSKIPAGEIMAWVRVGIKRAHEAELWRADVRNAEEALAWRESGFRRLDVHDWRFRGFSDFDEARRWRLVTQYPWEAARARDAGFEPEEVESFCAALGGVDISEAVRVLDAFRGDRARALQFASILGSSGYRHVEEFGSTDYSPSSVEKLLEWGLTARQVGSLGRAGVSVRSVRALCDSGLASWELFIAALAGYRPREVAEIRNLLDDVSALCPILQGGLPASDIIELQQSPDVSPDWPTSARCGTRVEDIISLGSQPFPGGYGRAEPGTDWYYDQVVEVGFRSMSELQPWRNTGMCLITAGGFARRGFTPGQGLACLQRGVLPVDLEAVPAGTDWSRVQSPLAGLKWAEVFVHSTKAANAYAIRRAALKGIAHERIGVACENLGVPHDSIIHMFSRAYWAYSFLDGGYTHAEGYGPEHAWIIGFDALRLICARVGLAQPKRLRGEVRHRTTAELEESLARQRSHDWDDLEARLPALLAIPA